MIPRPWVVLLAAGASSRFGRPKLLATLAGETLLRRAARTAVEVASAGCVVVLGAHAARHARELRGLSARVVVNRSWRTGLAGSLRAGIAALPAGAAGALILLADQVAIGPAELELLIAAWRRAPGSIVAAVFAGVRGPPAIFPRTAFPRLRKLRGDAGARRILRDSAEPVVEFDLPRAAVDVDRPADLDRFIWRRG